MKCVDLSYTSIDSSASCDSVDELYNCVCQLQQQPINCVSISTAWNQRVDEQNTTANDILPKVTIIFMAGEKRTLQTLLVQERLCASTT